MQEAAGALRRAKLHLDSVARGLAGDPDEADDVSALRGVEDDVDGLVPRVEQLRATLAEKVRRRQTKPK